HRTNLAASQANGRSATYCATVDTVISLVPKYLCIWLTPPICGAQSPKYDYRTSLTLSAPDPAMAWCLRRWRATCGVLTSSPQTPNKTGGKRGVHELYGNGQPHRARGLENRAMARRSGPAHVLPPGPLSLWPRPPPLAASRLPRPGRDRIARRAVGRRAPLQDHS